MKELLSDLSDDVQIAFWEAICWVLAFVFGEQMRKAIADGRESAYAELFDEARKAAYDALKRGECEFATIAFINDASQKWQNGELDFETAIESVYTHLAAEAECVLDAID
jgi:hypothetical protein